MIRRTYMKFVWRPWIIMMKNWLVWPSQQNSANTVTLKELSHGQGLEVWLNQLTESMILSYQSSYMKTRKIHTVCHEVALYTSTNLLTPIGRKQNTRLKRNELPKREEVKENSVSLPRYAWRDPGPLICRNCRWQFYFSMYSGRYSSLCFVLCCSIELFVVFLHIEAVCIDLIFSTLKLTLFLELHKKCSFLWALSLYCHINWRLLVLKYAYSLFY